MLNIYIKSWKRLMLDGAETAINYVFESMGDQY